MADGALQYLLESSAPRKGHFLLESGHHGELWLDLELLFLNPKRMQPLCSELAERLRPFDIEVICGPLVEGAFVGLFVASELDVAFSYSERFARPKSDGLFPAGYQIPSALRRIVPAKRVAIVNDVINAGSAVRGTFEALQNCGARVVAMGTLLALGNAAREYAQTKGIGFESIATMANTIWAPPACPLCAAAVPLEDVAAFRAGG